VQRSAPVQLRVRRLASLGAVAGTLIGSAALDDLSDLQLAAALRDIMRDFLKGGPTFVDGSCGHLASTRFSLQLQRVVGDHGDQCQIVASSASLVPSRAST